MTALLNTNYCIECWRWVSHLKDLPHFDHYRCKFRLRFKGEKCILWKCSWYGEQNFSLLTILHLFVTNFQNEAFLALFILLYSEFTFINLIAKSEEQTTEAWLLKIYFTYLKNKNWENGENGKKGGFNFQTCISATDFLLLCEKMQINFA